MRVDAVAATAYALNFAKRILEIMLEVEPIRRGNVARADNLLKLRLSSACASFKPELVYSALIPGANWSLKFADGSVYDPTPVVEKVLRKILDSTPAAQRPHNRERGSKGRRHEARA